MKRLFLIAAVLICSVSAAQAQSLKDLLKQAATQAATQVITNETAATGDSTTTALGNIASSLISSALGTAVNETTIVGTWTYTGPAVQFTSEDVLKQTGSAAAASLIEGKLADGLAKIGLKAGGMTYTFNEDLSFVITIGKRTIKGTYKLNSSTNEINLVLGKGRLGNLAKHTMTLVKTDETLDMVSKADKLLKFIQNTISSSKNSSLSAIGKLAEGYDGMMIGFSFTK